MANSFQEVLTAAVADITEHGYDNPARIARWAEMLREAAARATQSSAYLEHALREALGSIYRNLAEKGAILKRHPGVARFTLDRIKPELRKQLDKRILASASLIRLNRSEAISNTLRRFEGWATSIPQGGSDQVDKRKTKREIAKPVQNASFIARRVMVDQGHKLTAAINQTVAEGANAIACTWHSHWREPGYNYRPDHKERDQKVYLLRGSWALDKGLIKAGKAGYYDDVTAVGEEVFCFPGDSAIPFADGLQKAYRRFYTGDVVEISTASGKRLCGTPNHPILTTHGWIAIGLLKKGDDVIETSKEAFDALERNNDYTISTISQVFSAVEKSGFSASIWGATHQFHGDGSGSNIDVVVPAGKLSFGAHSQPRESLKKFNLAETNLRVAARRSLKFFSERCLAAGARSVCGFNDSLAFLLGRACKPNQVCFVAITDGQAKKLKTLCDGPSVYVKPFRDLKHTFTLGVHLLKKIMLDLNTKASLAGEVNHSSIMAIPQKALADIHNGCDFKERLPFVTQPVKVVGIERKQFSGYVYNLETKDGWYSVNGLIAHNCRCYLTFYYHLRQLPADMLTQKGAAELKRVRLD